MTQLNSKPRRTGKRTKMSGIGLTCRSRKALFGWSGFTYAVVALPGRYVDAIDCAQACPAEMVIGVTVDA
jgi:hypothetical protein